jgi:hypothetical protein
MSSHDLTIAGYVIVVTSAVCVEVAAALGWGGFVSLRVVFGRLMRTRSGRIGVMAAWAWLGLHFLAL